MTHAVRYPINSPSRMLPEDALFWYAEEATPALRPLVAGLSLLDRTPDRARFRASVQRLVHRVPRLQQRVVDPPLYLGLPEWEDDPYFDLDYHLREVLLPEPATERHLLDFASAVFASPLDHLRPLWEIYLIEGLEEGRAAYFFRAHHSIMDGVGSQTLFEAVTQAHRAEPVPVPRHGVARDSVPPRVARLISLTRCGVDLAAAGVTAAARVAARAVGHPGETIDDAVRAVRALRGVVRDLTAPPIKDPLATRTSGYGRRLDALTFDLGRMRRIKDELGVTLNDVVLAAVSGAVGRYYEHCRTPVAELRCMVPTSLRLEHERDLLGNRVGMFNITLPVGEPDSMVRLDRICTQMAAAKSDRRGATYPLLIQAVAFMPRAVIRALAESAIGRLNLICTNVPGPPTPRYIAGAKVEQIYPFVPVMLGSPLSIALMSYADTYAVGIDTDPVAIPDPALLHRYLLEAVDEVERRALPETRRARRPAAAQAM